MAVSQGYQCDFIDLVPDDFYCKKCKLVARRLTVAACCTESFCQACIEDTRAEGKPCPECGSTDFTILEHVKNQKRINCLQVYCSMKERGCGWTGPLEQLDTHLDPDQDNCHYIDTKCPLNCHIAISKSKIEQHVAKECVKRPFTCQYCNFKATYKDVVGHLTECKFVPLQCPNFCGVTFERDFLDDHMKICRLQEVRCEFSSVGCDEQLTREDQEEHIRQNSHKHLTLTASLAVQTKEQLLQEMLEQDKKHKEKEEKLRDKIEEQEKRLGKQEKMLMEQKKKLGEQEKKLVEQEKILLKVNKKLNEVDEKLVSQESHQMTEKQERKQIVADQQVLLQQFEQQFNLKLHKLEQTLKESTHKFTENEQQLSEMAIYLGRRFKMKNFSIEKALDIVSDWKSPAMFTHLYGYKFCIGVDANGSGRGRGNTLWVDLYSMPGKYDKDLKYPAKGDFTLLLLNQEGGDNIICTVEAEWEKPVQKYTRTEIHPYSVVFLKAFWNITNLAAS